LILLLLFVLFVQIYFFFMKVSIITAVLNCAEYIEQCICSVKDQDYGKIEHIIIDGGSNDGTLAIIEKYKAYIDYVVSEEDKGLYDALNKGLAISTGDLIGCLNADDLLASEDVISSIVREFNLNTFDAIYGNLDVVSRTDLKRVTRRWRSKQYKLKSIEFGWMPAHPTFFIKREVFWSTTPYSLEYGTCGDYDFMLHLLYRMKIKAVFLDCLIVLMRRGGMSNGSCTNLLKSFLYDYKILVKNDVPQPLLAMILKKIRKLGQFR